MIATKPRILCVDDEPNVLKFLEAVLVPNGYEVTKAEDGEEAMKKLKEERIDLVLSDVTMPKMDGFELCRRIKGDDRYRNIP
jgi:CheY-like chemotaxis protein